MTDIFCPSRRCMLDILAAALILGPVYNAHAQSLSAIKIATVGAGNEGGALGTIFAKLGHPVMFSSRHPEQLKDLVAAAGPNARAGSVADAVAFAEIIVPMLAERLGALAPLAAARERPVPRPARPAAPVEPRGIADFIDDMLTQERRAQH